MNKQPSVGWIEGLSIANILLVLWGFSTFIIYSLGYETGPFNSYGRSLEFGFFILPIFMLLFVPAMIAASRGIRSAPSIKNANHKKLRLVLCWASVVLSIALIILTMVAMGVFNSTYS